MHTRVDLDLTMDHGRFSAELIRAMRDDAGLTQTALAERLGTKQPVISRWESGADEPRLSTLRRIAASTGHRLSLMVEPDDVDRSQIRELLGLSPRGRIELLAADAAGLDRLLEAAGR